MQQEVRRRHTSLRAGKPAGTELKGFEPSCPLSEANAFRVRPVMTTSIQLHEQYNTFFINFKKLMVVTRRKMVYNKLCFKRRIVLRVVSLS